MKKMGKTFLAGTAFAITALTMAGCGQDDFETLYGPPPTEIESEVPNSGNTEPQTTEPGSDTFDPSGEIEPEIYGPPPVN